MVEVYNNGTRPVYVDGVEVLPYSSEDIDLDDRARSRVESSAYLSIDENVEQESSEEETDANPETVEEDDGGEN